MFLVCATCRTRLSVVEGVGLTDRYKHSVEGNLGHDPVPVPEDVLVGLALCTFCSQPAATAFPVNPLGLISATDANLGDPVPTWLACAPCAALVEANDYTALSGRAATAMRLGHGLTAEQASSLRAQLIPAYDRFRSARTGPPVPLS